VISDWWKTLDVSWSAASLARPTSVGADSRGVRGRDGDPFRNRGYQIRDASVEHSRRTTHQSLITNHFSHLIPDPIDNRAAHAAGL
jgi:hypothetical protein